MENIFTNFFLQMRDRHKTLIRKSKLRDSNNDGKQVL